MDSPQVHASLIGGAILIVTTFIGWFITFRIARLARESSEAIAAMTRAVTERQVEVAMAQVELNRQTQAMNLLKDRVDIKRDLLEAIDDRSDEIKNNSLDLGPKQDRALNKLIEVQGLLETLFADDVQNTFTEIQNQLIEKANALSLRNSVGDLGQRNLDRIKAADDAIDRLKRQISAEMNEYSKMGHIRMLEPPSK